MRKAGKIKSKYQYTHNIGDILIGKNSNMTILEQIKIKDKADKYRQGYICKCLVCTHEWSVLGKSLDYGSGCPVCSNNIIKKGINDMWTTKPQLAELLANPEDGYKYSRSANVKVDWICPSCKTLIKNQSINYFDKRGLTCSTCSDGVSYPNKFSRYLLDAVNQEFIPEYSPEWCKYLYKEKLRKGYYDNYFIKNGLRYILEMDGGFHRKDNNFSGQTKEESNAIDFEKDKLAIDNGIEEVIRIDCSISDCKFIKENILKSKLAILFDLSEIDWRGIDYKSFNTSLVIEACNLWNNGITKIIDISVLLNVGVHTIARYLKKSADNKLCDYRTVTQITEDTKRIILNCWNSGVNNIDKIAQLTNLNRATVVRYLKVSNKEGLTDYDFSFQTRIDKQKIKIVCLNTEEIFKSPTEAREKYKVTRCGISACCKGARDKSAGKHPDTGDPLIWMYYDEYIIKNKTSGWRKRYVDDCIIDYNSRSKVKVVCLTTGKIFNSLTEGAKEYNIESLSSLSACCIHRTKYCGKHPETGKELLWMYYDEYLAKNQTSGWFEDYISNYNNCDKVICLTTGEVFDSQKEAGIRKNIHAQSISGCCKNKLSYAGTCLETGKKLVWMYYEEYLIKNKTLGWLETYMGNLSYRRCIKVICLTTGEIFESQAEAGKKYNAFNITSCCKKKLRTSGKHPTTNEKLRWMYYDEYIKLQEAN